MLTHMFNINYPVSLVSGPCLIIRFAGLTEVYIWKTFITSPSTSLHVCVHPMNWSNSPESPREKKLYPFGKSCFKKTIELVLISILHSTVAPLGVVHSPFLTTPNEPSPIISCCVSSFSLMKQVRLDFSKSFRQSALVLLFWKKEENWFPRKQVWKASDR